MQMVSHRSEEYKTLHTETVEMLQKFLATENEVFLFSSTGSGFMEASVRNCVTKKMLSQSPFQWIVRGKHPSGTRKTWLQVVIRSTWHASGLAGHAI